MWILNWICCELVICKDIDTVHPQLSESFFPNTQKHFNLIGASLSEPHIDRDNSPRMYVSNIFTRVCRTLVPKIRVGPEMLRVFQYIDVFTCVVYNCEQQGSS